MNKDKHCTCTPVRNEQVDVCVCTPVHKDLADILLGKDTKETYYVLNSRPFTEPHEMLYRQHTLQQKYNTRLSYGASYTSPPIIQQQNYAVDYTTIAYIAIIAAALFVAAFIFEHKPSYGGRHRRRNRNRDHTHTHSPLETSETKRDFIPTPPISPSPSTDELEHEYIVTNDDDDDDVEQS